MANANGFEEFKITKDSPSNYFELYFIKFEANMRIMQIDIKKKAHHMVATEALLAIASVELLTVIVRLDDYVNTPYPELKAFLEKEFICKNDTLNEYKYMTMKPLEDEDMFDYIKRLKMAAKAAKIDSDNVDNSIIMQVLCNCTSTTIKSKIMELTRKHKTKTLDKLIDWLDAQKVNHEINKDEAAKAYKVTNEDDTVTNKQNVLTVSANVKVNSEVKRCHFCYEPWPHPKSNPCEAKEHYCGYCNGKGHFLICCLTRMNDVITATTNNRKAKAKVVVTHNKNERSSSSNKKHYEKQREDKYEKKATKVSARYDAVQNATSSSSSEESDSELQALIAATVLKHRKDKKKSKVSRISSLNLNFNKEQSNEERKTAIENGTLIKYIKICGKPIKFILDTGSAVNIIHENAFNKLLNKPILQKSNQLLKSFNTNKLQKPIGEFKCKMTTNGVSKIISIQVIKGTSKDVDCLISCKTMLDFKLISLNQATETQIVNRVRDSVNNYLEIAKIQMLNEANELVKRRHAFKTRMLAKYPNVWLSDTGLMPDEVVDFEIDESLEYVQQKPYNIDYSLIPGSKKTLARLEAVKVIERIPLGEEVTYVSPLRVVSKNRLDQDGDMVVRVTSDARQLNKAVKTNCKRIMPNKKQIIYNLAGKKYFSKVDIKDAFHTLAISERCKKHTAFSTPWGRYRYTRLWMGFAPASEIFHEKLVEKLADLVDTQSNVDDILTATTTLEQAEIATEALIKRLNELNLTCDINKCKFLETEVEYWGLCINGNGIKAKQSTIDDLLNTKEPNNLKDLKSYVCLASFFHESIPYLSTTAKPLRALYKKNAKFTWSNTHAEAFNKIKQSLIKDCLAHFDPKQEIELWVDASSVGIGAFLINTDRNNKRKLVSCASKTFDEAENNLSMVEKEGLALAWGVLKFSNYLMHHKFTVYTDNKAIFNVFDRNIISRKVTTLRLQHWRSTLSQFNGMNVKLIKSEDNIADYMSRCLSQKVEIESESLIKSSENEVLANVEKQIKTINATTKWFKVINICDIVDATDEDSTLKHIKQAVVNKHTHLPKDKQFNFYREMLENISITSGMLTYFNGEHELIILPDKLVQNAIGILHEGHMKANSVKKLMKSMYIFKHMDKTIEEFINFCIPCQANTDTTHFEPNISTDLAKENMV